MQWQGFAIAWAMLTVACAKSAPCPTTARSEASGARAEPRAVGSASRAVPPPPIVSAAAAEQQAAAPPKAPDDGVPRCERSDSVLVAEFRDDSLQVVELRLNGERVKTWFEQRALLHPAIDLREKRAIGVGGLVDLTTHQLTPLAPAERWGFPMFVPGKPWVISPVRPSGPTEPSLIDVFDYEQRRLVQSIRGVTPSIGPAGEILFLHFGQDSVEIRRYESGRMRRLKRIALVEPVQDVSDLVALGGNHFAYRIEDDHERRYYLENDEPFFPGQDGHWLDFKNDSRHGGRNKEQFNLTLSENGRWAALAERNWNELTYFVIVDRKAQKRHETPFYGSYPAWFGDTLLFSSDPEFIRTDDPQFRQIAHFVLYAYEPATRSLCKVGALEHDAIPYGPQGPQ